MAKIVFCGPPKSGKSCLLHAVKEAIRRLPGAPYPYVITANPDGEGAWFQETAHRDAAEARSLKLAYKTPFTEEFAQTRSEWVRDCPLPLTLVDVGGRIDEKNRSIMRHATHAVIVSADPSATEDWREFCRDLNLRILAIVDSNYDASADQINCEDPILLAVAHRLERGEDLTQRLTVAALAAKLVSIAF